MQWPDKDGWFRFSALVDVYDWEGIYILHRWVMWFRSRGIDAKIVRRGELCAVYREGQEAIEAEAA